MDITSGASFGREMERDSVRKKRMEEKKKAFDALLDLAELAELRKSRGITQAELAERLGVSQPNVAKIEAAGRTEPPWGSRR